MGVCAVMCPRAAWQCGPGQRGEGAALLYVRAGLHVSLYHGVSVGAAGAHELPPPRRQPPEVPPLEPLLAQRAPLLLLLLQVGSVLGCRHSPIGASQNLPIDCRSATSQLWLRV